MIIFTKIFNLSFLDCVKHFRGDINIDELEGFIEMDEVCKNFEKEEKDYSGKLKWYITDFEKIVLGKKARKKKVKKTVS